LLVSVPSAAKWQQKEQKQDDKKWRREAKRKGKGMEEE
jgi:hypothetical protein